MVELTTARTTLMGGALARAENLRGAMSRAVERLFRRNDALAARVAQLEGALEMKDDALRRERSANESMHRSLSIVSHELRAPISAVLGWARLLKHESIDDATRDKGLATIERNARRQADMVDGLLDFARIETGKIELDIAPAEVPALVERALLAAAPLAEARGIDLAAQISVVACVAECDAARVEQILVNLLSNAIKFSPRNGRVDVALTRSDDTFTLRVSDQGDGITAEVMPTIFEPFRQDTHSSKRSAGLGLGLAIVRHLVEVHGGSITAESRGIGTGASFMVTLPMRARRTESEHATNATDKGPLELHGVRVLLLDTDPAARDLWSSTLRRAGAETLAASCQATALGMVTRHRPDVVLVAVEPGRDDFIRALRALAPFDGGGTPAIAMIDSGDIERARRHMLAGYQLHVRRTAPAEVIIAAVDSATSYPNDSVPRLKVRDA
jgi:signal transduction histidine kinase/CheY-like chemotaxis protein